MMLRASLGRWSPMALTWPFRRLLAISIIALLAVWMLAFHTRLSMSTFRTPPPAEKAEDAIPTTENTAIAKYFIDHPVAISEFGEMGHRVQLLTTWINDWGEHAPPDKAGDGRFDWPYPYTPDNYTMALENLTTSLFPFIRSPHKHDVEPLRMLRKTYQKGRGIVIPVGRDTFRFACHLILNLRTVLHSDLPIQIMYSGDDDLPLEYRKALKEVERMDVDFVDVGGLLDDTTMGLEDGKWAIKPFAILASSFEEVILIDADAVFMQKPEVIFDNHGAYKQSGTLFFHDRLVDQGEYYDERIGWIRHQMRKHEPSETFQKSIAMREGYGQEGDSGVVVLDKRRLNVLMALLHVCWQNSKEVREKETYQWTHGDKESYWLGFELSGVPYRFAEEYGGAIGFSSGNGSVYTSQIAQVDQYKKLLWVNGSLMKKKADYGGEHSREYYIPNKWMLGGNWTWTYEGEYMAMMNGSKEVDITRAEREILEQTIWAAKYVDRHFENLIGLPPLEEEDSADESLRPESDEV